jgi:hypothetical protein
MGPNDATYNTGSPISKATMGGQTNIFRSSLIPDLLSTQRPTLAAHPDILTSVRSQREGEPGVHARIVELDVDRIPERLWWKQIRENEDESSRVHGSH